MDTVLLLLITLGCGYVCSGSIPKHELESYEAIKELHSQMDDDHSGSIDLSESIGFVNDELSINDPTAAKRQEDFHNNDDQITVDEMWQRWTQSQACKLPQHLKCTTISAGTYKDLTKANPQVFFTCFGCSATVKTLLNDLTLQNDQIKSLASTLHEQQSKLDELSGKIDNLVSGSSQSSYAAIAATEPPDSNGASEKDLLGQAVTEMQDIERRKTNAVVFNLAEFKATDAVSTKPRSFDVDLGNQLALSIEAGDCNVVAAYRLGDSTNGKRPLKLIFEKSTMVNTMVNKAHNLRNTKEARFKSISIKRDLTKWQQVREKKLYDVYKLRKDAGEQIRFFDGRILPLGRTAPQPQEQ